MRRAAGSCCWIGLAPDASALSLIVGPRQYRQLLLGRPDLQHCAEPHSSWWIVSSAGRWVSGSKRNDGWRCRVEGKDNCSYIMKSCSYVLVLIARNRDVNEASWAWGQGRGRGQKKWGRGRGRGPKIFSRLRPRPQCMRPRPRPDTLENNSVCMSIKTKILAFRT